MRLVGRFLFVLHLALLFSSGTFARAAIDQAPASAEPTNLIGWRFSSKIVLAGNFSGVEQLRQFAAGLEVRTEAEEEGDPTPLMKAIVSILSEMDSGRLEVKDGKLSVIGTVPPARIAELRSGIERKLSKWTRIAKLQIGSSDEAPAEWVAYRSKARDGGGVIEMNGSVKNETVRAQLIGMARNLAGDLIVVDRMRAAPNLSGKVGEAAQAMLAQLKLFDRGFVAIYGNKFDIVGVSRNISVSDKLAACRSVARMLPTDFGCGLIDIGRSQADRLHEKKTRDGRGAHRGLPDRETKPFIAVAPNEITGGASPDEFSDPRIVDILFATTRKRESESSIIPVFSAERSQKLTFGLARVRIPTDHKIGRLELPGGFSIFGIKLMEEKADPEKHFILRSRQVLTPEQWDSLIEKKGADEAIVFVHGFNTSFDDSVFRFAQIVWDLKYEGLPVLFSWASRGAVLDYQYDRESALIGREAFLNLLENLRDKHRISTVHIIAHSMGNFLVLDALAHQQRSSNAILGQLIMAAPDVDSDQFVQNVSNVKPFFRGLTLYASSADKALASSRVLAGGVPRAGDVPSDGPIIMPGLETIDVTALGEELFGLNHTTFAQSRPLMNDIKILLKEGRRAPRLIEELPMPDNQSPPRYWRFAP